MTTEAPRPDMSVSRRIGKDAAGVSLLGGLTRIAPLFSTIVIAAIYGAGSQLDIYFLTMVLPVFLSGLVGMAITSVFVPVLVEEKNNDPAGFPVLLSSVFSYVFYIGIGMTLIYALSAPFALPVMSRAFDEAGRRLAVQISLLLSPVIVLTIVRSFLTAVCHSRKRFVLPTLALSLPPVLMIVSIVTLQDRVGIFALAIGNVAGHGLEVLVMAAGLSRLGGFPRLTLKADSRLKRIFSLASPQVLSASVLRFSPVIDRTMASILAVGSISALVYAERMQSIPQQILSLGFFNVLLAHWSFEKVTVGLKSIGHSLVNMQKAMITALVPVVCFFWLYRDWITQVLLERGALGTGEASLIATVFGVYALQIIPLLLKLVYVRVLLVMKETVFLMRVGFFTAGSKLALNCLFILALGMDVRGIALATVLTSWAGFLIFNIALKRRLGFFPFRPGIRESAVVAVSTVTAAAFCLVFRDSAESVYGSTVALFLIVILYFTVYAFFLYVFRERHYLELRRLLAGR